MPWWKNAVHRLLSQKDQERIVAAIAAAELRTSGEIRVHVEATSGGDPLAAARRWFVRLGMQKTAHRNGILIYVAVDERAFAIAGDDGIHVHVGDDFWNAVRDALREDFARGAFADGLVRAIGVTGDRLAAHFPRETGDRNELPNEISGG